MASFSPALIISVVRLLRRQLKLLRKPLIKGLKARRSLLLFYLRDPFQGEEKGGHRKTVTFSVCSSRSELPALSSFRALSQRSVKLVRICCAAAAAVLAASAPHRTHALLLPVACRRCWGSRSCRRRCQSVPSLGSLLNACLMGQQCGWSTVHWHLPRGCSHHGCSHSRVCHWLSENCSAWSQGPK